MYTKTQKSYERYNLTRNDIAEEFKVSTKTIGRWVDKGIFKYGVHYVDIRQPNDSKAILRFNLEACRRLFLTPPEKR